MSSGDQCWSFEYEIRDITTQDPQDNPCCNFNCVAVADDTAAGHAKSQHRNFVRHRLLLHLCPPVRSNAVWECFSRETGYQLGMMVAYPTCRGTPFSRLWFCLANYVCKPFQSRPLFLRFVPMIKCGLILRKTNRQKAVKRQPATT